MTRRKHDVIIVGAGLFGAMAARLAHEEGHRVTVVDDDKRQFRASPCSGCVIAPSWLTALSKQQIQEGRGILSMFYGLEPIDFQANLGAKFAAERVRTSRVLTLPDGIRHIKGEALSLGAGHVNIIERKLNVGAGRSETLRGKVLVAAGIWCQTLLSGLPTTRGLYGASLLVSGQIAQPRLYVYAPYRQAVAFNMDNKNLWFGDGTALIEKTWQKEGDKRVVDTIERFTKYTGIHPTVRTLQPRIGARPYMEGHKAGYYRKINNALYISTGGAKNGTLLAALQAQQFINDLKEAR